VRLGEYTGKYMAYICSYAHELYVNVVHKIRS
jgi:hypothetical protein